MVGVIAGGGERILWQNFSMHESITRRAYVAFGALASRGSAQGAPELLRLPQKVRLGFIGLEGHIGLILDPLKMVPDVELVAISDSDPRARASMARRPCAAQARQYSDYRRLLDKEKLDMVAICGVNGERTGAILACAERKLHVIAEKPLAIERADLERIRKAVLQNGIRLTMLLPMRFSPPYLAIKQIVDSGQLGEVAQIGAQKSYKIGKRPDWMRHRSSFGGTIPYIGVHMVDLMRWISRRELVEALAFQARVGFPHLADMENTTATLFRLDNGGVAVLHMDYLRPQTAASHGDDRLRLAGTEGVVEYQASTGVTLITRKETPRVIRELPQGRSLFLDFLDSVYHSKPAWLDLPDIFRVNEIVLAARESAEQRQIVKI